MLSNLQAEHEIETAFKPPRLRQVYYCAPRRLHRKVIALHFDTIYSKYVSHSDIQGRPHPCARSTPNIQHAFRAPATEDLRECSGRSSDGMPVLTMGVVNSHSWKPSG
ncbi:MAG TPA: hypothetical protein VIS96_02585 [Terrimicrobiaceae bacterium]